MTDTLVPPSLTTLDYAQGYGRLGWRIFPLWSDKKQPMYKGWQSDATADKTMIQQYFGGSGAPPNIGVVCGDVFDAWDVEYEHLPALTTWMNKMGHSFPEAPIASTARGGTHILTQPTGVNGTRYLYLAGKHIGELKSAGGFIVLTPSVFHDPDSGKGGPYSWLWTPPMMRLPKAPDWLLGLLERPNTGAKRFPSRLATPDDVVAVLGQLSAAVMHAGEGSRNNYLYWAMRRALEEGVPGPPRRQGACRRRPPIRPSRSRGAGHTPFGLRRRGSVRVTKEIEDVLAAVRETLGEEQANGKWHPQPADPLFECEFIRTGFRSWGLEAPDKSWKVVLNRLDFGSSNPSALLEVYAPNNEGAFGDLGWMAFTHSIGVNGGTNFNQCVARLAETLGGAKADWARRVTYLIGRAREANAGSSNGTFSTTGVPSVGKTPPFVFSGRVREGRTMSLFGPGSAGKTTIADGLIASACSGTEIIPGLAPVAPLLLPCARLGRGPRGGGGPPPRHLQRLPDQTRRRLPLQAHEPPAP